MSDVRNDEVQFSADEVKALRMALDEYLDAMEEMAYEFVGEAQWRVLRNKLKRLGLRIQVREQWAENRWRGAMMGQSEVKITVGGVQAEAGGIKENKIGRVQHADHEVGDPEPLTVQQWRWQTDARLRTLEQDRRLDVPSWARIKELEREWSMLKKREGEVSTALKDVWERTQRLERADGELSEGYEGLATDVQELMDRTRSSLAMTGDLQEQVRVLRNFEDLHSQDINGLIRNVLRLEGELKALGESFSRHSSGVAH